MEDTLDDNLENMLSEAEHAFFEFRLEELSSELDEYEDNLEDLARASPAKAKSLLIRHREVSKNRGVFCPQHLTLALEEIQERVVSKRSTSSHEVAEPIPILETALLRRLNFE